MTRAYAVLITLAGLGLAALVAWPRLTPFVLAFYIPLLTAYAVTSWQAEMVRRHDLAEATSHRTAAHTEERPHR